MLSKYVCVYVYIILSDFFLFIKKGSAFNMPPSTKTNKSNNMMTHVTPYAKQSRKYIYSYK